MNLIFKRRAALDALGEPLLHANRTIGQPTKIATIFGRKVTKRYRGKLETVIEDLDLPNPVIRSYCRDGSIKQYVRDHLRDHLGLRTEATSNSVRDFGVPKAIAKGYTICVVFLKLLERVYAPLTAGLLAPVAADGIRRTVPLLLSRSHGARATVLHDIKYEIVDGLFLRNGVSFNLRMISPPSSTLWRDRNQLIIKPLRQPQREALTKSASSGHFTKLAERTLRIHRDLILNYFKAKKVISS